MKKILLVEDDVMLAEIYQKKFSHAGYDLIVAASGGLAQEKAQEEKPDLILLDLVLPEEDGFSILKNLKSQEKTKDIKVVIFSNLSQEEDKQQATSLGAVGFIAKSDFTPQQVVAEVEKILSNGKDPAQPAASEAVLVEETFAEETSSQPVKSNGKKILIVEDEEVFIEVFGRKLEDAGFEIVSAKNGAWGLKLINEQKFDLLILDVLMPSLDGYEIVQKVRAEGINKQTPILMMSNSIDDQQADKILSAGANEFLVKTKVTPSELVAKVEKLIA